MGRSPKALDAGPEGSQSHMKANLNIRRYWAAIAIALTLGIGIVIGTFVSHGVRAARPLPAAPGASPLSIPSPAELSNSFARIAAKIGPAVVNINTESTVHFGKGLHGPGSQSGNDWFNHFFHQFGPDGMPHNLHQQSLGSGVILDKNGYILTNYHVIMQDDGQPVDLIRVFLQGQDGQDGAPSHGYTGKIVGYDRWTDLAIIKISADKALPTAQLGDSDTMRVGDWVLAIGSPFGLNATVTAGIISAKGRQIDRGMEGEFKHFLQTDAAINPGNSGGPLVNLAGQVVGINTAIATTKGAYDGVGFAIPSRIVRRIYNSIITTGTVRRGAIGVSFMSGDNSALLRSFGADHGVVVQSVERGSPAEHAGLKRGDVITAINSKPVHNGDDLLGIISNTAPGAKIRVDYLRDHKSLTCYITVGDWSKIVASNQAPAPDPQSSGGMGSGPEDASGGKLGVSVKALTSEQAKQLSQSLHLSGPEGVMVDDVKPGSPADDLQIQRLDVILSINHADVKSTNDFNRLEAQLKRGQDVLLLIARQNSRGYSTYFLADQLP